MCARQRGKRRKRPGNRKRAARASRKRQPSQAITPRLVPGHEQIALLVLSLACYRAFCRNGSRLHLHRASRRRDEEEATDFILFLNVADEDIATLSETEVDELLWRVEVRHDRSIGALRIDATTGHIGWKIDKNKEHREAKGPTSHWPWGVGVQLGDETTIIVMMDEHRRLLGHDHFDRLKRLATAGAVRLSPADICPKHGEGCELVQQLELLAGLTIAKLPVGKRRYHRNWRQLLRSTV